MRRIPEKYGVALLSSVSICALAPLSKVRMPRSSQGSCSNTPERTSFSDSHLRSGIEWHPPFVPQRSVILAPVPPQFRHFPESRSPFSVSRITRMEPGLRGFQGVSDQAFFCQSGFEFLALPDTDTEAFVAVGDTAFGGFLNITKEKAAHECLDSGSDDAVVWGWL